MEDCFLFFFSSLSVHTGTPAGKKLKLEEQINSRTLTMTPGGER